MFTVDQQKILFDHYKEPTDISIILVVKLMGLGFQRVRHPPILQIRLTKKKKWLAEKRFDSTVDEFAHFAELEYS